MKILILTSAHPTDDVRVHSKIARGFVEAGHEVVWSGPRLSFFEASCGAEIDWRLSERAPGWRGRLFGLAKNCLASSNLTGVDWIYTPDPDAAIAALILARRLRAKTVFDLHEDFHRGLLRRGVRNESMARVLGAVVQAVLRLVSRMSDLTIAVSQTILDAYSPPGSERLVVLNTATRKFAVQEPPQTWPERLVAMHGKALESNGSSVVLDALALMPPEQAPETIFITAASATAPPFSTRVAERLEQPDVRGLVRPMSGIPHDQMPSVLARCQVGLIAYGRALGAASLPNRLFEYMAVGLAVLAPNYSPEIARILHEAGNGLVADFEDPHDVAEKLLRLTADPQATIHMGERGRREFIERYSWEAQMGALLERMGSLT